MKRRKNNSNANLYLISNPMFKNENSGMFAISPKYIMNYDKDFLFEWKNPKTNEMETKILTKEYVKDHITYCKLSEWDELHINKEYKGYCFLISYNDIKKY